ncbi:hypothetical protein [Spirosoma aerolatum]|uniref:hypothetical protein n=1 Tax=Spirosoma aerolatum TaxID=1211326 RepID=UPI0009ACA984|nr:hypothetical protein [Spirosoma aerolatum]
MKKAIVYALLGCLILLSAGVFAQSVVVPPSKQVIPTATRVFSTTATNKITFQNGTAGRAVSVTKGTTRIVADKTNFGANVAVIQTGDGAVIWSGRANTLTISGVSSTTATKDSLNRKWLDDNLDR